MVGDAVISGREQGNYRINDVILKEVKNEMSRFTQHDNDSQAVIADQ